MNTSGDVNVCEPFDMRKSFRGFAMRSQDFSFSDLHASQTHTQPQAQSQASRTHQGSVSSSKSTLNTFRYVSVCWSPPTP